MKIIFSYLFLMMIPTIWATSCEQCYFEIQKIKSDLTKEIKEFIEYSSNNSDVTDAENYINNIQYKLGIIEGLNLAQMKVYKTHKSLD